MPPLRNFATEKSSALAAKGQGRALRTSARGEGAVVERNGKQLISFSCNDYLGLSHHPRVIAAAQEALARYGAGAGASRLVTGNHPLYEELERKLAAWKGCEAALVFGSGYLANLGIIPALAGRGDLILADKLAHACILDGARLSGAKLLRFAHNDVAHLRTLLETDRAAHAHCLIVTDGVFSMDGDVAPVAALAALAREHDAWLMVDDAHGLGVLNGGRGSTSGVEVDVVMGTLSKALGGYGGYVCGSTALIEYLISAARSLVFSTGLPPAAIAAASVAMDIIAEQPELSEKPLHNARLFTKILGLPPAQSAIVPVILGDAARALAASAILEEEGVLVTAIRPPTVPEGTARLRFAFSALHREEDIARVGGIVKREGWVRG